MLDFGGSTTNFTQFAFLTGEAFTITQLGVDLHQLEPQVTALRFVIDGILQQFGGLIETTIGDIDVSLAQRIAGLCNHAFFAWFSTD